MERQNGTRGTRNKTLGPAAKLTTLQNKCLRSIIRAYKATNIKVLEAQAGVLPLDIYLDQTSTRRSMMPGVMNSAKEKIRKRLRGKSARSQPGDTPMLVKDAWAEKNLEEIQSSLLRQEARLYKKAGTQRYQERLSTGKGLGAGRAGNGLRTNYQTASLVVGLGC